MVVMECRSAFRPIAESLASRPPDLSALEDRPRLGAKASALRRIFALIVACVPALLPLSALAEDVSGSADHPLVGRYEGSSISFYKHVDFDEAELLTGPYDYAAMLDADRLSDRSGPEWLHLEGSVTDIRYDVPAGRSSLEVMQNYLDSLEAKGLQPVFQCKDADCLSGKLRDPYLVGQIVDATNGISTAYFDHARYLLAAGTVDGRDVHAVVLTGEYQGQTTAFVRVVEGKALARDKIVFLTAPEMQSSLEAHGTVDLHGILFDTDQDALKPESRPTIAEIAKLLESNPEMRLEIVGHTDNVGTASHNLDLSRRRATKVVSALTEQFGVKPSRLQASGKGFSAPVAPNDTAEGRAENRRVELRVR